VCLEGRRTVMQPPSQFLPGLAVASPPVRESLLNRERIVAISAVSSAAMAAVRGTSESPGSRSLTAITPSPD
jgi:hypothetical protein